MINLRKTPYIGIFVVFMIVLFDRITKVSIVNYLQSIGSVKILPFLNFTLVYNKGISFGMINSGSLLSLAIIGLLTLVIVAVLIKWLFNTHDVYKSVSLGLIIGGAFGNLIDRFVYGGVVDFIDFYLKTKHFPAFNIADSSIFIGVVLLLCENYFLKSKGERN